MTTSDPNAHIVLFEPEIPQNTGNIARTCACTDCSLTLVDPIGFQLSARRMKRAGLDYWDEVAIERIPSTEAFLEAHEGDRLFLFTGKAERSFDAVEYQPGDYLIFGRESTGIDEEILARFPQRCVRIPMASGRRSLNLSNAVAVAVFELLKQTGYRHVR